MYTNAQYYNTDYAQPAGIRCDINGVTSFVPIDPANTDYANIMALVYRHTQVAAVYNFDDPVTEQMVRDADVIEGCRAVGFTLGIPGLSMLGLVDDILVDRAFIAERASAAQELCTVGDVPNSSPANVANALAAAALARSFGVTPGAVREGLRAFVEKRKPRWSSAQADD
jgi:UDP-N-acetylmuramoylalanine-D-glutamate ligase